MRSRCGNLTLSPALLEFGKRSKPFYFLGDYPMIRTLLSFFRANFLPSGVEVEFPKTRTEKVPETRYPRIRCPQCKWQPDGRRAWFCSGLSFSLFGVILSRIIECSFGPWNPFETECKCPSCGTLGRTIQCPVCDKVSPRQDWYEGEKKQE